MTAFFLKIKENNQIFKTELVFLSGIFDVELLSMINL